MPIMVMVLVRMDGDIDQLLARVAAGDKAAFARLYDLTSAKLFCIISRILPRGEMAEDALQEAFVRIWQRASRYDSGIASPMAWMATIARNQAIDLRRRFAERLSANSDEPDEQIPAQEPDPAVLAEQADEIKRLEACLGQLPPERRDMILLAYHQGWSREELSARYSRPITTVKTLLRRSLIALKECLDGRR